MSITLSQITVYPYSRLLTLSRASAINPVHLEH